MLDFIQIGPFTIPLVSFAVVNNACVFAIIHESGIEKTVGMPLDQFVTIIHDANHRANFQQFFEMQIDNKTKAN